MVFAREIAGQELSFGVSGKLIMNAVVMYDHQADTLWSQFLAAAVSGPLVGNKMELIPAQLTTWGAWLEQHPDTKLLDRTVGGAGFRDTYNVYYNSSSAGVLGQSNRDDRLPTKELVVGLDHGLQRIAYSFTNLKNEPVVNGTYDGAPVLITHDPVGEAAAAFDRTLDGRVLTFTTIDRVTMRDQETGSTWSSIRGEALSGELVGSKLEQLPAFVSFWFAWTDFYPSTDLYEPGAPGAT
jgi:hypothetical protein